MKHYIINFGKSIISFFKDRECRLGFFFIIKFCIAISLCTVLAYSHPWIAIILAILIIDMPFSTIEWLQEPTKENKQLQKRMEDLIEKMKQANDRLDKLLK